MNPLGEFDVAGRWFYENITRQDGLPPVYDEERRVPGGATDGGVECKLQERQVKIPTPFSCAQTKGIEKLLQRLVPPLDEGD